MPVRTFIAVDLPAKLAPSIDAVQSSLREAQGLRCTDPERTHITLKFLGETERTDLKTVSEMVQRAIEETGIEPFEVKIGGFGVFPSLDYIRVVWADIQEGTEELTRLHHAVEKATTGLGFEPEEHDFSPHVTLARMNDARSKERVQELVQTQNPAIGRFTAKEAVLMESTLTESGPEYAVIDRFRFGE